MRLNLAMGILTALIVSALVGAVLLDAQPRLVAESRAMMKLTEAAVGSSLPAILDNDDPKRGLIQFVSGLGSLRHVSVEFRDKATASSMAKPETANSLVGSTVLPAPQMIPVVHRGASIGDIVITARPADELDELWQSADKIIVYGAALVLGMVVLNGLVIKWSLRPVSLLDDAISSMEQGKYSAVVPQIATPELRSIGARLNGLAAALGKAKRQNQDLIAQIIRVQEEERRAVARDLHDEIGANLFALRTKAALLLKEVSSDGQTTPPIKAKWQELVGEVEHLQVTNRRILRSLMPPALNELGLPGAVQSLAQAWRKNSPGIDLKCSVEGNSALLDETVTITAYRILQEALTNAYRHAGGTTINGRIAIVPSLDGQEAAVEIAVEDNGRGMTKPSIDGFGLRNMRNRAKALGGTFEAKSATGSGLLIEARLPLTVVKADPSD